MISRIREQGIIAAVVIFSLSTAYGTTKRITYDLIKHIETTEIDVVDACKGQTACTIQLDHGQQVQINGASAPAQFEGGNTADGLIKDKGDDEINKVFMSLPANPNVTVSGAYTINSFAWKPAMTKQKFAPGGWSDQNQCFNRTVAYTQTPDVVDLSSKNLNHFCISPQDGTPFSLLWIKFNYPIPQTSVAPTDLSFSQTMRMASEPLLAYVREAFGAANQLSQRGLLLDEIAQSVTPTAVENAQVAEIQRRMSLLVAALDAAQNVLDPANHGGKLPSVDHPQVVSALRSVVAIWDYVEPVLQPLEQRTLVKFNKKNMAEIDADVPTNSFIKNLKWLRGDIKAFEISHEDIGSSATFTFSELLLQQLNKVQPILGDPNQVGAETGKPTDFRPVLADIQTKILGLETAAQVSGETSSQAAAAAKAIFDTLSGPEGKDMMTIGQEIQKNNTRNEIMLFQSEIEGLQGLPCASGLSLK